MGSCHYKGTMGKFSFMWGTVPRLLRADRGVWGAALLAAATWAEFPLLSPSWPSLSTRQRSPRWGSSTASAWRSWTGGELSLVSSWDLAVVAKITKHHFIASQDTQISLWVVQGIFFNTWLCGFTLFPSHKSLFSRPWEESRSQHCTWGMSWCYIFFL